MSEDGVGSPDEWALLSLDAPAGFDPVREGGHRGDPDVIHAPRWSQPHERQP